MVDVATPMRVLVDCAITGGALILVIAVLLLLARERATTKWD